MPEFNPELKPYALTTLEAVKAVLKITSDEFDDVLTFLINANTDNIERIANRRFIAPFVSSSDEIEPENVIEEYSGDGSQDILLNNYPVLDIDKVEIRTLGGDHIEIDAAKFQRDDAVGQIHFDKKTVVGFKNYRITYRAGYEEAPSDLQEACINLVLIDFNDRKARGITSETLGQYSVRYNSDSNTQKSVPDEVMEVINRYRRLPGQN